MLNRIAIMGRFTRDPELKYTPSGKAVLSFTLACDRDYQPKAGDKKNRFRRLCGVEYHRRVYKQVFQQGAHGHRVRQP